jgi:hypothetical protein
MLRRAGRGIRSTHSLVDRPNRTLGSDADLGKRHLRRVLAAYAARYNVQYPHLCKHQVRESDATAGDDAARAADGNCEVRRVAANPLVRGCVTILGTHTPGT